MLDLTNADTLTDDTAGPGRVYGFRLRPGHAGRLDAILARTGESPSELFRRLTLVHLDALDASTACEA